MGWRSVGGAQGRTVAEYRLDVAQVRNFCGSIDRQEEAAGFCLALHHPGGEGWGIGRAKHGGQPRPRKIEPAQTALCGKAGDAAGKVQSGRQERVVMDRHRLNLMGVVESTAHCLSSLQIPIQTAGLCNAPDALGSHCDRTALPVRQSRRVVVLSLFRNGAAAPCPFMSGGSGMASCPDSVDRQR